MVLPSTEYQNYNWPGDLLGGRGNLVDRVLVKETKYAKI